MSDAPRLPMKKDYLGLQLRDMPYFRGLLRAVEARFYEDIDLPAPTLDLGCGDGHFATIAFDRPLDVGIDPWRSAIREAPARGGYRWVVQGAGARLPFADGQFASAVSNSVLEHIPELDPVLAEMWRVLQPGARFVFCVPNQNFLPNLSVAQFLDRLGLKGLAAAYRRFFNRISRHYHCDAPDVWQERLERAGFRVVRWWHYFSPAALHTLEWGHYLGLPALLSKRLFGRWILARHSWNLALTRAMIERHYTEDPRHPEGAYTFYIAQRVE